MKLLISTVYKLQFFTDLIHVGKNWDTGCGSIFVLHFDKIYGYNSLMFEVILTKTIHQKY